ncbi:hypothetical protein ES705_16173 [subsurface metagenome]
MTIDKAIEIKSREGEEFLNTDPDEIDEAERLSIEALKAWRQYRITKTPTNLFLLPGEEPQ